MPSSPQQPSSGLSAPGPAPGELQASAAPHAEGVTASPGAAARAAGGRTGPGAAAAARPRRRRGGVAGRGRGAGRWQRRTNNGYALPGSRATSRGLEAVLKACVGVCVGVCVWGCTRGRGFPHFPRRATSESLALRSRLRILLM